jgi:hypothetical protein
VNENEKQRERTRSSSNGENGRELLKKVPNSTRLGENEGREIEEKLRLGK